MQIQVVDSGNLLGAHEGMQVIDALLDPKDADRAEKLKNFGFPENFVTRFPDFTSFLFDSGLIFTISTFQNTTSTGVHNHGINDNENDLPVLKMNGEWVRWDEVKLRVRYDDELKQIVSIHDSNEKWNYISPDGLVPLDRFHYESLYPIEQLDSEQYTALVAHAKQFWNDENPEVDVGIEKDCVLQVVTSNRVASDDWLLENALKAYPEHVTYRLIDNTGAVYSFGIQMPNEESEAIFNSSYPLTILKTVNALPTTPDYEETKPFSQKRVTSIPLTQIRLKTICDFVSALNKNGMRFNFIRQNCATFGREILKLGGIYNVKMRMGIGEFFSGLLPDLRRVPHIGETLSFAILRIQEVTSVLFATIETITPNVLKITCTCVIWPYKYISNKLSCLFLAIFGYYLSAADMSSPLDPGEDDDLDNSLCLRTFSRLFRKIEDIFTDEIYTIDHSLKIIEWQLRQPTTCIHYPEAKMKMPIVPPAA